MLQAVILAVVLGLGSAQSTKEQNTDENRPYEFGFTIEGEQHRYEKKDEKGIIMGEFGFITADGVYHITVYATDENGNFKILKTKNIRIGLSKPQTTTTTPKPAVRKLNGISGCSGCLIPTPGTAPQSDGVLQKHSPINGIGNKIYSPSIGTKGELNSEKGNYNPKFQTAYRNANTPRSMGIPTIDLNGQMNVAGKGTEKNKEVPKPNNQFQPPSTSNVLGANPKLMSKDPLSETEIKVLDFMARLYKFNYTLTYHGHEEEGDVEGNKRGSYFTNGRDGYQRKVVYVANEFGYQPRITLVKLDPSSVPKEDTEKVLTELKGNEFIWYYDRVKS